MNDAEIKKHLTNKIASGNFESSNVVALKSYELLQALREMALSIEKLAKGLSVK